jgi:dienelactone hydrolase
MGIATFMLDSFSGRGISEICTGRQRINTGSAIADAYRALELLSTHPRIDSSRIAIMGFSWGGRVSHWVSLTRFQRLWNSGDARFAAYLAFYPPSCNHILLEEADVQGGPIRIFLGTEDDVVLIGPCRDYVTRMRQAGKDVGLVEYPSATHAFDHPLFKQPRWAADHLNPARCMIVELPDGRFVDRDTGSPAGLDSPCVSRGYLQRADARAHRQAIQDVKAFLSRIFKLNQ